MNNTKGFATVAGEGERIWFVADTLTLKATAASTDKSYTVVECLTAPGGGPPPHVHTREDEFWYVLDGTFEIHIGDKVHAVGPGGFAFGPRGTPHHFRNTAATPSRILLGFTPGGIEGFFRESGQPATNDGPAGFSRCCGEQMPSARNARPMDVREAHTNGLALNRRHQSMRRNGCSERYRSPHY